jgi:hypothetical protein
MHAVTTTDHRHLVRIVAAALAVAITIGMFAAVIGLFQVLGLPPADLAAAERACADRTVVAEREACIRHRSNARDIRMAHR